MENKRTSPRYHIGSRVECVPIENTKKKYKASCYNASLGGICIELKNEIKEKSNLNVFIYTKNCKIPVECKGEIIWQKHVPRLKLYRAGIKLK